MASDLRTLSGTIAVLTLALVLAACGQVTGDDQLPGGTSDTSSSVPATPATTATTAAAPTTTARPTTTAAPCLSIPVEALRLLRDYNSAVRSIAGADEEKFRADARALADKARRLGCPVPSVIANWPAA
jgi:hypothetical protein